MRQEDASVEAMRELAESVAFPLPSFVSDVQNISDVGLPQFSSPILRIANFTFIFMML